MVRPIIPAGLLSTRALPRAGSSRRRGPIDADEFPEFHVVVQAIEIGILGRPIPVAVSGRKGLFERLERLCFSTQDPVRARSIVEGAGIAGTKGHGGLQVP